MRLRTDDDIYRARLVYLGPPGYTLPVQLPYAQYGLFVVLVPLYMGLHFLLTQTVDAFPAWEIALAMVTTSYIFRHVDPDRPARPVSPPGATRRRRPPRGRPGAGRPPRRRPPHRGAGVDHVTTDELKD